MTPERWDRIKQVFDAVFERPEEERAAFLDSACAGDVDLRAEVEQLLEAGGEDSLQSPTSGILNAARLAPGDSVAHYRIECRLGEGGMGVVYKARDSRLGRSVALKFVTAQFSSRNQREARTVAALNHPNICTVHDVGPNYLVMELIEGLTLADRMAKGAIPLKETLDIASQIAEGMAAAHSAGIVHRDLKPANVMLTADGRVKILDFGLARQTLAALGSEHSVTLGKTVPGTILGTASYMSPEQARGVEAGPQADQFSFGVILYEMTTGKRAFERDSIPQTLTAILVEDPPPIEAKLPAPLRWTIGRCLAKDPHSRYESTRDLYRDLRNQQEHFPELLSAGGDSVTATMSRRAPGKWLYLTIPAACLATAAAMLLFAPEHHGFENFRYTPVEISRSPTSAAWSPDGKAFAYSALVAGKGQIFVRYLNSSSAAQITHEGDAGTVLGWSPDSKRIFINGKNPKGDTPPRALLSLSVTGGEPDFVMPLDAVVRFGESVASVSPDGKVLVVMKREGDGTFSVSTSSPVGAPLKRYTPAPFETRQLANLPSIRLSPGGARILYFLAANAEAQAWDLPFPAGSGLPKRILKDLSMSGGTPTFSWFPDNRHIAISLQNHLSIVDTVTGQRTQLTTGLFDEETPAVSPTGGQVLFFESIYDYRVISASLADASTRTLISSQRGLGMPAWTRTSDKFAYVTSRSGPQEIWLHDSDGSERPLVTPAMFPGPTGGFMNPTLSPAGDRIAYTRHSPLGEHSAWISSLAGGPPVRLTNTDAYEDVASWSPDGARLVYCQGKGGVRSLMICRTSGQATPIELRSGLGGYLPDWSPTGEWISSRDDSGWNLISPDGKSTRSLGKIASLHLTFSKDGQTLYGIRTELDHQYLFSLSLANNQMKTIGDVGTDFVPRSHSNPGVRFSLSPDGKSILYPTYTIKRGLWMLAGFDVP